MQSSQTGLTMLEVLVAAIILMVALLGMGALQINAMKKNTSMVHKTQAMESISYMGDALRSQVSTLPNSSAAVDDEYNGFVADLLGENNYQSHYMENQCESGCTRKQITDHMLAEWELVLGENLPQGKGKIERKTGTLRVDGQNVSTTYYEVTVMWDDRQLVQSQSSPGDSQLGTDCSGNPKIDLTCWKTIILP